MAGLAKRTTPTLRPLGACRLPPPFASPVSVRAAERLRAPFAEGVKDVKLISDCDKNGHGLSVRA